MHTLKPAGLRLLLTGTIVAATAVSAQAGDGWQWSLTPYIWATDLKEDLVLDGAVVGGQDLDFKDLADKVESSFQVHLEGMGDRWGMFADVIYIDLSDTETGEQGLLRLDVSIEEMVNEGGAIFRPGGREGRFDLLLGARYFSLDETYRLTLGGIASGQTRVDDGYLDALLGARFRLPLSDRWVVTLRGDYSLGDTDGVWTAQGMVEWRFGAKRKSAILGGYRHREMEYGKADTLEVERELSGFAVGVKIGF